ncbi:GNAT family N-acetyltransferase [Cohnella endophytica]|uniref:GNAT family N-acetyltransferase n=1 Tax=Cohnella endophytica TaxID=2419778 RepID=A0A494XUB1_9BACL|nr:GNAT family N-acetyltransferase [Cohnella endophytica]RKP54211.1 GNAT family N-acetyltransferase [Cohnella endophytica]
MTIKSASPRQAASISKLVLLAIGNIAYQLTGANNDADALGRLEEFIGSEGNRFSNSCILVEELDGKPVGMILCYHGKDADKLNEPIIRHLEEIGGGSELTRIDKEADEDEYYIDALAVDPAYQGRGIAKQLIAAAEIRSLSLGHDKIALNVEHGNEGAHRLYRKLGYEADKEITINRKPFRHMIKKLAST